MTDATEGLVKASIGMQAEADMTGKQTVTGLGKADSGQASPGLRQAEASGSMADSECVSGLAGLTIGTECGKSGEEKTFGNFGNNLDLKEYIPQSRIRTCCGMAKRKMYNPVCGPRACDIVPNYILIIARLYPRPI